MVKNNTIEEMYIIGNIHENENLLIYIECEEVV
ncbi:hypothetical protein [Campylobacter phage vB_Cj_QDYZ]|uniref:Uncharacterized protein n=1 Tax=Campylobacter phage vB_Cj_QDYZ TaxID=3032374 RepID=A0AAF0GBF7_9CAUD|nr:hypothetical protein [Campylobacter phage vB_Cj_QDYZ]